MSVMNFFRNLFGTNRKDPPNTDNYHEQQGNEAGFRNPIWQNDDEDDIDDFSHPEIDMHFHVFSDPLEITRFFESEMDRIMKSFFFGFGDKFKEHNALPAPPQQKSLRDDVLKPEYNQPVKDYEHSERTDNVLDGKVTVDELSRFWNDHNGSETQQTIVPFHRSFGKSVSRQVVHLPNGTVEERKTVKDSEGNEETIISRQVGDKKHVIITKKDQNGIVTKSENLINIDENELQDFNQKWKPAINLKEDNEKRNILNNIPWEKFFGPNPKL